jgi:proteasome lid subunit RPN8/RPN11
MDKVDIVPNIMDELTSYGKKHSPEECCGLLTGITTKINNETRSIPVEFHPINNVSKEPYKWDYVMDPNQYMSVLKNTRLFNKKSAIELTATFHTHPNGMPVPSQFDVTGAAWHTVYLIYGVSIDAMAAWFWNGIFFKRISINEKQITDHTVYNDGKDRNWKSWRNVGSP